jgi:CHRD domain
MRTDTTPLSISRRVLIPAAVAAGMGAVALTAAIAPAAPASFQVAMVGAREVPPVDPAGKGTADLTYDAATRVLTWTVSFGGLSSPATMAHFHGPAEPGKNGPVTIWVSKQGTPPESPIKGEATLTPEQAAQFVSGQWYINVHSQSHPGGEIRGQVMPPK